MSYFNQKIQIIDRKSNYPTTQQQNDSYTQRYKRFLLAQTANYDLHSMIHSRNGPPTNMSFSTKKLVNFGSLPRFFKQRYRLRNILLRTQPYRLFSNLPTIYEEENYEKSQSNFSLYSNIEKSTSKMKRFKPCSYYSNFTDEKNEIDYNNYLYSDSYSETKNKKKIEAIKSTYENNRWNFDLNTLQSATFTRNTTNNLISKGKQNLEMKDRDIELQKHRGTIRSSSVDSFSRPDSSVSQNSIEKKTIITVRKSPKELKFLKLQNEILREIPKDNSNGIESSVFHDLHNDRLGWKTTEMYPIKSNNTSRSPLVSYQFSNSSFPSSPAHHMSKPSSKKIFSSQNITKPTGITINDTSQNNNGLNYFRLNNSGFESYNQRFINESPKIKILNRIGELPPKPLRLNVNSKLSSPPSVSITKRSPPTIGRTMSTLDYTKSPILVERSKSMLTEKDKPKQVLINSYQDETKQQPIKHNLQSYTINNNENDSKNIPSVLNLLKVTPNQNNSKLNMQKLPVKNDFGNKKEIFDENQGTRDQSRTTNDVAAKTKKLDSTNKINNKLENQAPSNFYKTYLLNEPKNEYRIEDYLYKPSTEPVISNNESNKNMVSNSISNNYLPSKVAKPIEKDVKSKSTIESSDFQKKRSLKKRNDDENRLFNIIKDLKVTLETYMANGSSNDFNKVVVNKKQDVFMSDDLKSPINSVYLDNSSKSDNSRLSSSLEKKIDKLEIIY